MFQKKLQISRLLLVGAGLSLILTFQRLFEIPLVFRFLFLILLGAATILRLSIRCPKCGDRFFTNDSGTKKCYTAIHCVHCGEPRPSA
jgi:hypothetical protein